MSETMTSTTEYATTHPANLTEDDYIETVLRLPHIPANTEISVSIFGSVAAKWSEGGSEETNAGINITSTDGSAVQFQSLMIGNKTISLTTGTAPLSLEVQLYVETAEKYIGGNAVLGGVQGTIQSPVQKVSLSGGNWNLEVSK